MGFLFSALKFKSVIVILWKQAGRYGIAVNSQGLGKFLPEIRDSSLDSVMVILEHQHRFRPQPLGMRFLIHSHLISLEPVFDLVVAVNVVWAVPADAAAGVLVQPEPAAGDGFTGGCGVGFQRISGVLSVWKPM